MLSMGAIVNSYLHQVLIDVSFVFFQAKSHS